MLEATDGSGDTYVQFLEAMRAFFAQKVQMRQTLDAAAMDAQHADTLRIMKIAARGQVNRDIEKADREFLGTYDRNPSGAWSGAKGKKQRAPTWEQGLVQLEQDKDRAAKPVTEAEARAMRANVIDLGQRILAAGQDIAEDYRRMAAKLLLRIKLVP